MIETVVHKWLNIPYSLNIGFDSNPNSPTRTVIFIHGLANSHSMWDKIVQKLSKNNPHVRYISVDLLGFGDSPKPIWQKYNTITQARSLRITLLKLRVNSPVTLVGHSLGALVSIQYAKKYPSHIDNLLLCSPPFYKPSKLPKDIRMGKISQTDDAYHLLYRNSRYRKELAQQLAVFMRAAKLTSKHFVVNDETMPAIVSSLEMSIENQTALDDAKKLKIPIKVLYGQFDPFVIKRHLKYLCNNNQRVKLKTIAAGHEISSNALYRAAVINAVESISTVQ